MLDYKTGRKYFCVHSVLLNVVDLKRFQAKGALIQPF